MPAAPTLHAISAEYLKTQCEPDCEYLYELESSLVVEIPVADRGTLRIDFDELYSQL